MHFQLALTNTVVDVRNINEEEIRQEIGFGMKYTD